MSRPVLHAAPADKFIPPFIEFVKENFDFSNHQFYLSRGMSDKELKPYANIKLVKKTVLARLEYFSALALEMHKADKIILHGLFDLRVILLLWGMPWLLKKCYWVMWGGDLYVRQLGERNWKWKVRELFRGSVIKKMGHFVTYIEGDYDLAKKWYRASGQYHHCLMYLSNVYKELSLPPKTGSVINIMVGNSADPSNNHAEVFEKLLPYKDHNIQIFCPLSYGQAEYAEGTSKLGEKLFGDKFTPLLEFMPFDKYLDLLGQIDIAVFAHKRQQAMGNTITLLGLGKKVYMRNDVTSWEMLDNIGVSVFNMQELDLLPQKEEVRQHNQKVIKNHFSEAALAKQLHNIFGS